MRPVTNQIPFAERLTCTVPEACQVSGLGRTKLYELIGNGRLETRTIGRRRLILVRSLTGLFGDIRNGDDRSPATMRVEDGTFKARGHDPAIWQKNA